jgi:hypothetical protein
VNPYVGIVTSLVVIGLPCLVAGLVFGIAWLVHHREELSAGRAARLRARRTRVAQAQARWQDWVSTSDGLTLVSVRKVGRYGKSPEDVMVLEEHELGSVRESDPNAEDEISELWRRAQLRAVQLNSGPLG